VPDTIYALSSAPGKAGIAVLRVSGPAAGSALEALAGRRPHPRRASVARLRDPVSRETLDEGLVLWFPAPRSFTAEDVAELHVHGGRATVQGVLAALNTLPNLRLAQPGEFARRAFIAGRLDLAEAEALADLIDAETAAQRRQALDGLDGGISARAADWRERLVALMALAEAAIDFADEDDVPAGLAPEIAAGAEALAAEITAVLDDGGRGERLRTGATIVVTGRPNVGKSTLLNCLAAREAAIVSPHPGTTRDAVEVHLDLGGYPATLVDTAGLRDSADPVEQEGIRRARARAAGADLVLWLDDDPSFPECPRALGRKSREDGAAGTPLSSERGGERTKGDDRNADTGAPKWHILTKIDLISSTLTGRADFAISCQRGDGIQQLGRALTAWLADSFSAGASPLITRARQREACADAVEALRRAARGGGGELVAEDLRLAARALGRLVGRVDCEDVLDRVFSAFCIGK
jgi:tRNA modification GTPase